MTIELSLLLSGVSVAFAIFFGICSKQRNEKKDTQEDAEQRATTDTMVMVKLENIADDLKDIKRESRDNSNEYHKRANFPENSMFSGISLYFDNSIRHHKNTQNFHGN